MSAHVSLRAVVAVGVALTGVGVGAGAAQGRPAAGPTTGAVQIVQAVPSSVVAVQVDGRSVRSKVAEGSVVGPLRLSPGTHAVRFVGSSGGAMRTSVTVRPGSSTDVVLHLPATVGGKPVVNVYHAPRGSIGPGKARVLVAHTATAPPADVQVDGTTVFRNIANGEFAQADVPAGKHRAALLPAGQTSNPILGPLELNLAPRTVTMIYAVGRPTNRSMDVISHSARLTPDGSTVPGSIRTGSAGLAAHQTVAPFGPSRSEPASWSPARWVAGWASGVLVLALGLALVVTRAGGRAGAPRRADQH